MNTSITDYGAVPDGQLDCTQAMQRAVDACANAGGGDVRVPSGVYRTGTIELKSGVCLYLEAGAEIRAVASLEAFPSVPPSIPGNYNFFLQHALIRADGAENIGIRGQGTINGLGGHEAFARTSTRAPERYQNRPSVIRFVDCTNVRIEGVQIRDSAFWTLHLMACQDVVVHGITIRTRSPNYNCDGIDVDSCDDVRISDCLIDSEDDAISIKGTTERPCRRVLISNCALSSHCNAVRVGAENFCAFEDIRFSHCHIYDSRLGITFQNLDGYPMRRVSFVDISIHRVAVPIHMITSRKTYPVGVPVEEYPIPHGETPAAIEDVLFDGIQGREIGYYEGVGPVHSPSRITARFPCTFSGHPQAPLRNLLIRNLDIRFIGGGTTEDAERVAHGINERPNPAGESLPAYGLFLRHAQNATLSNIRLGLENEDARPAILIEHGHGIYADDITIRADTGKKALRYHEVEALSLESSGVVDESAARTALTVESDRVESSASPFSDGE